LERSRENARYFRNLAGFTKKFVAIAFPVSTRSGKDGMTRLISAKKYFSTNHRLTIKKESRPYSGTATDWK
jgi:hypothetical protein